MIKYTVIDRGGGEFIPVVDVAGCEIYRGSIHHNAVTSEQADMKMLAIQERDEARARVAELEAALGDVLSCFVFNGLPGADSVKSRLIDTVTFDRWRQALRGEGK